MAGCGFLHHCLERLPPSFRRHGMQALRRFCCDFIDKNGLLQKVGIAVNVLCGRGLVVVQAVAQHLRHFHKALARGKTGGQQADLFDTVFLHFLGNAQANQFV